MLCSSLGSVQVVIVFLLIFFLDHGCPSGQSLGYFYDMLDAIDLTGVTFEII